MHDVLALLSFAGGLPIVTKTIVPGVPVPGVTPLKLRMGFASTVKVAEANAPLVLVAVTV